MKTQATLKREASTAVPVLYTAFELSNTKWKLAFSNGDKLRHVTVTARILSQLQTEIGKAKKRFRMPEQVRVVSCYEAGRDGFWLHRYLTTRGIENLVVDSSSIEVNRRKRRAKSDRIDAGQLLRMLMRYHGGEKRLWSVVRVPTVEQEDARQIHRELEVLNKERTCHRSRIRAFLIQHGIQIGNPSRLNFLKTLGSLRTWDGKVLPPDFKARVVREYERLQMVEDQIKILSRKQEQRVKS